MKYFVDQDESCHWYVIPALRRAAWEAFLDIPEDDELSWNVPAWAIMIDGASSIEFENWSE